MLSISPRLCVKFSTRNYKSVAKYINFNFKSLVMHTKPTNRNRFLAILNKRTVTETQCLVTQDEAQEFMSFFPEIVRDLTVTSSYEDVSEFFERFGKVLKYNVPHGKKHRGLRTVAAYKAFESAEKLTPENIRLANILGWGAELMQTSLIVEDDIENSSKLRRGSPSWYTVEGVGLQAINDIQMLENSFYSLVKKHFSHLDCYVPIMEMYHEMLMKTRIGYSLDSMCRVDSKPQFNYFTMKIFGTIAEYKTTYHAFQMPILLAMHLAGKRDSKLVNQVTDVLQELGQFYQIENDVLDWHGSDIAQGKCTWLAVTALQRATPVQRNVFQENYGRSEPEREAVVRNLYEEMHLFDAYLLHKKDSFNLIRASIERMSDDLPKDFFNKFLKQIYKNDC